MAKVLRKAVVKESELENKYAKTRHLKILQKSYKILKIL